MRFITYKKNENKSKLIADIDYKSISNDIPLTDNAIKQWQLNKNNIGYSRFDGLTVIDCISIISGVKRAEVEIVNSRYYSVNTNIILYRIKTKRGEIAKIQSKSSSLANC